MPHEVAHYRSHYYRGEQLCSAQGVENEPRIMRRRSLDLASRHGRYLERSSKQRARSDTPEVKRKKGQQVGNTENERQPYQLEVVRVKSLALAWRSRGRDSWGVSALVLACPVRNAPRGLDSARLRELGFKAQPITLGGLVCVISAMPE